MHSLHTKATIGINGDLHINSLPFSAGETVEVIVISSAMHQKSGATYPLRNTPVVYIDPFEPVCETDWESAQ